MYEEGVRATTVVCRDLGLDSVLSGSTGDTVGYPSWPPPRLGSPMIVCGVGQLPQDDSGTQGSVGTR